MVGLTHLNLWCLSQLLGEEDVVANHVLPTDATHIRKCMKAGLVKVSNDRRTLILTDKGRAAIEEERG